MSGTVFVVLAECGEYSDRNVWVAGIFATEVEAQQEVDARLAVSRVYTAWHDAFVRELLRLSPGIVRAYTDEERAFARSRLPPEPPYERAERCEIVEAPIGEWIK